MKIKKTYLIALAVGTIFLLGLFLRFFRFYPNVIFNGEMGIDFMNVLSIIKGDRTWMLGPRTSHEWLYVSPISYWLYILILSVFSFNPVSVNVFWGIIGSLGTILCYFTVKKIFDEKTALISSFLFAISPSFIALTRDARFNSPIALLFFPYLLYLKRSIEDKGNSLFKLALVIGLMYNFFPSPLLLIPAVIVSYLFYRTVPKVKYIFAFVTGLVIPNITFIFYDCTHKCTIITSLLLWIPYRILGFFGLYHKNTADVSVLAENVYSAHNYLTNSFTMDKGFTAMIVSIFLISISVYLATKYYKSRKKEISLFLLFINFIVCYIGLFIHGNPPGHYYYIIYPIPLIIVSYFCVRIVKNYKIILLVLLAFFVLGMSSLIKTEWYYTDSLGKDYDIRPVPYDLQLKVVEAIKLDADGKDIALHRRGINDKFEQDFAGNYVFLLTTGGVKVDNNSANVYTVIEGAKRNESLGSLIFSERDVFVYKNNL